MTRFSVSKSVTILMAQSLDLLIQLDCVIDADSTLCVRGFSGPPTERAMRNSESLNAGNCWAVEGQWSLIIIRLKSSLIIFGGFLSICCFSWSSWRPLRVNGWSELDSGGFQVLEMTSEVLEEYINHPDEACRRSSYLRSIFFDFFNCWQFHRLLLSAF